MYKEHKKYLLFLITAIVIQFIFGCMKSTSDPITGKRYYKSGNKYFKTWDQSVNQYFRDNPERPAAIKAAIRRKEIKVGMTAEEVLLTKPQMAPLVRRSVRPNGVYEQWIFAWPYSDDLYVYFKDGIVIATYVEHVTFRR
jgi:hypothetical protein